MLPQFSTVKSRLALTVTDYYSILTNAIKAGAGPERSFSTNQRMNRQASPYKIASGSSQLSTTNYQLLQPLTPLNSLIHKPPRLAYTPLMKAPSSSTASLPRDSHPARLCLCASSKNEQRQSHRPHQVGPFPGVAVSLNVKPGQTTLSFHFVFAPMTLSYL